MICECYEYTNISIIRTNSHYWHYILKRNPVSSASARGGVNTFKSMPLISGYDYGMGTGIGGFGPSQGNTMSMSSPPNHVGGT